MSNLNSNKRIAKNTVFLSIRMVIVLLIGLYTSRVLLQTLGVEDYGVYNVVGGFVSMFAFVNSAMNNGIQRFYNYELGKSGEDGARKVYRCALITQTAIAIIVVVATETFGLWYMYNKMVIPPERFYAAEYIFQFSIISIVLTIMQIPFSAAVTAHERMDFFAIVSIIDVVLKLVIIIILPIIDADHLITYGFLIIIVSVFDFLMYFIYARRNFQELHGGKQLDKSLLKEMVSFSGWNLFGSFSYVLREQGLNLLLNAFFGPIVNAARGVAYQILKAVQSFVGNITTASRPQLTQSFAQGNITRTFNIMYSMSKMCYISVFVFALPVMLEVDSILSLWLGNNVPEHTSSFALLIVGAALIHVFNPPTSFVVHATGKMRKYQTVTTIFSLLLLPISYLFLKKGAAPEIVFVLYFIFMFLGQLLSLYILHTIVYFSIKDYLKKVIWPCFLLTLLSSILPLLIRVFLEQTIWRLLGVAFVSGGCVLAISYAFVLNNSERSIVKGMIKRKRK